VAFELRFTEEANRVLDQIGIDNQKKARKVHRALAQIEHDPRYPGLQSHQYKSKTGPNGEPLWESYVENQTPGAWRIFWSYGPDTGQITILTIGPHPD
jgi:hypothetical protein